MYRLFLLLSIAILLSGCGALAPFVPETSNALAQQAQLDRLQEQNQILKQEVTVLERIADLLEATRSQSQPTHQSPQTAP